MAGFPPACGELLALTDGAKHLVTDRAWQVLPGGCSGEPLGQQGSRQTHQGPWASVSLPEQDPMRASSGEVSVR